eukprot:g1455.t1
MHFEEAARDCSFKLEMENTAGTKQFTSSSLFVEVADGHVEHYRGAKLESLSNPGMCLSPVTGGYMIQNYRYSVHRGSAVSTSWCVTECVSGSCGGSILNGNVMLLNTCNSKSSTWINRGPHLINAETGNCLQLCTGSEEECVAGEWGGINVKTGKCENRGFMELSRSPAPMSLEDFMGITVNPHSGASRCLDTCLESSESGSECNIVGKEQTINFLRAGLVGRNIFGQRCGAYAAGHNQAWKLVPHSYSMELKLSPCDDPLVGYWTMRASRMMLVGGDLELNSLCISNDEGIDLKLSDCNNRTVNVLWNMMQRLEPKPSPSISPSPSSPSEQAIETDRENKPPSFLPTNGLGSNRQRPRPLSSQETNGVSDQKSAGKSTSLGLVLGLVGAILLVLFLIILTCCYYMKHRRDSDELKNKQNITVPIGIKIDGYFSKDEPPLPPPRIQPTIYSSPLLPQSMHNTNYLMTNPALIGFPPAVNKRQDSNLTGVLGDMNNLSSCDDDLTGVLDALSALVEGSIFAERYVMESERIIGRSGVVCFATNKFSKASVAIKFYSSKQSFHKAKDIHTLLSAPQFCRMEDAIDHNEEYPPALIFEKGDYTLSDWLTKTRPNHLSQKLALNQILEALVELHRQRLVHRDLKPSNIMWFSREHMWKLVDLDTCVLNGTVASVAYTPLYAAPEAIKAQEEVSLETSADMWSFGIIAFETLTGVRFYGPQSTLSTVVQAMNSPETLPSLDCISEPQAKRFISNLICLDPRQRWSATTVLQNAFFKSAEDTLQQQNRWNKVTEQLNKICELVEITAEEVRTSNMMASITMEYFKKKTDHPLDPFHLRQVAEVCSISDDNIPDQPVHLLNIGSPYRLHVALAHDQKLNVPIEEIHELRLTPPDGQSMVLETVRIPSNQAFEFVALWDPKDHNSQRLNKSVSGFGRVHEKYVVIEVSITYGIKDQYGMKHHIKGRVFCQMHPPGSKFRLQRFTRLFHKAWEDAPQWMRDAAKGTVLLATVGANAITL